MQDQAGAEEAGELLSYRILQGELLERIQELDDESIDAVVTDPPYGIRFMGASWDGKDIDTQMQKRMSQKQTPDKNGNERKTPRRAPSEAAGSYDLSLESMRNFQEWTEEWALAVKRVLKPGGYLLSFASTRTYHRMTSGIEDAGFEIRDQIGWTFGSGFPKSRNLHGDWEGWGTALKPAWEPICVARKPLIGTVQQNVDKYGTGAININGCRIEGEPITINRLEQWSGFGEIKRPEYATAVSMLGRWPANLIHDGSNEVLAVFPEAPGQCADVKYDEGERENQNVYGAMKRGHEPTADKTYSESGSTNFSMKPGARRLDSGSAARFFYCAKADRTDRNQGCEELPNRIGGMNSNTSGQHITRRDGWKPDPVKNNHPTVKPTDLMRYLVRLVTPPGGTVLDCFAGSGSTLKAALLEGFDCIGIEREEEYVAIAEARCEHVLETDHPLLRQVNE